MRTRLLATGVLIGAVAMLSACSRAKANGALDPTNELPFGTVDIPVNGATVPANAPVVGWALDDRGIQEVRVYVDGHFTSVAKPTAARPDVVKVFPQYSHGSDIVGWTMNVDLGSPGAHTILVQAVDNDGATRDIGSVKVTSGQ